MSESKPGSQAMNERERFEKWVLDESGWGYDAIDFKRTDDGAYIVPDIESGWLGWQAALSPAPPAPSPEELAREIAEMCHATCYIWSGRRAETMSGQEQVNTLTEKVAALLRPHLERAERWIPVGERLPEPNWYGLIYSTDGNTEIAYFRRDPNGPQSLDSYWMLERTAPQDELIRLELEQVTHWRPLPSAPDMEEK